MQEGSGQDAQRPPELPKRPPPPPRRARKVSAAEEVREAAFPVVMRGYDRHAVESWRERIAELISQLEEAAPRDAAVRRALDEVGQETAAILQRAHESADEITSRSRSQAEGRLQRAEREAEMTIREADERAERLEVDAQAIWHERSRLLDEMRSLADELLGVTDDAIDRLEPPRTRAEESEAAQARREAGLDSDEDADEIPDDEAPTRVTGAVGSHTRAANGGPGSEPESSGKDDDEDTLESPAAEDDSVSG